MGAVSNVALQMRAVALRGEGFSDSDIAKTLDIGVHSVGALLYRADQKKAREEQRTASKRAEKERRAAIEVPTWVKMLKLDSEYREIAATQDEFAAAGHCRALKRNMGAPA